MKRSNRRHQQQVAKVRRLRILYGCAYGHSWRAFDRPVLGGTFTITEKPWRACHRCMMNEPGWWVREFHTRPARIQTNRIAHRIVAGADPDSFQWPDGKKPHTYYW